jgi:signal transduction histidine kinase
MQLGCPLRIVRENVALSELIKKAIASITLKCPTFRFILTHAKSLPKSMYIDASRITQALHNLLINAVKYSPDGGIVEVATTTGESSVSISIKDYGLGMTTEQVEQIFDKFYRANPGDARIGGLGLGMTIVKQIIEDHNGDITISSNPGKGTTVTLTLPIEATARF